ncbi:MAG: DNA adenine methylase [Robiginitomaculum sp.]|nr:DNA adenine methylase [Robiginitomaculum sp.]
MPVATTLKQRSDYTHKYNITSGRHGWLRLTPAYSIKVVEEILALYPDATRVLDPFCGTGTTALCSINRKLSAATTDINPFLIWFTTAKTRNYSKTSVEVTRNACRQILKDLGHKFPVVSPPPIHNIERWWSEASLKFLCEVKGAINNIPLGDEECRDLLNIAFCRTLIKLSNAAFNHQSMSFKDGNEELDLEIDRDAIFTCDIEHILASADEFISETANVYLHDARKLNPQILGSFDLVITSPPYANRMSYIRELRPYMYWLGYLKEAREAGELDWQAIGGTWGIATSRLKDWTACKNYTNEHLSDIVLTISRTENKHAETLSRYVHKYCEDIYEHLVSLTTTLKKGARVHYIIGNSTFYGNLVKVEEIYADMMREVGFDDINIRAIRKRNSKKELVEFDVSAIW